MAPESELRDAVDVGSEDIEFGDSETNDDIPLPPDSPEPMAGDSGSTAPDSGEADQLLEEQTHPAEAIWQGELMLKGNFYSDTASGGQWIKFHIQHDDLEFWRGQLVSDDPALSLPKSRRYIGVFFELDDEDNLVAPSQGVAKKEEEKPSRPVGGALSKAAAELCQRPEFAEWCRTRVTHCLPEGHETMGDEKMAAMTLRTFCGVESRALLDHDDGAAALFHALKGRFIKDTYSE